MRGSGCGPARIGPPFDCALMVGILLQKCGAICGIAMSLRRLLRGVGETPRADDRKQSSDPPMSALTVMRGQECLSTPHSF